MALTKPPSGGKKAWVTLLTKPDYVPGLLTVHYTLQRVSSYPLVVMATSTLPASSRSIVRSRGMEIVEVDHLAPGEGRHGGFDPQFVRLVDAWTKLRVFGLEGFEKVVMIDSDMIFLRGMDEIFDMELPGKDWIGAAPACICNPLKISHYPKDWIIENCAYSKQERFSSLTDPFIPPADSPRHDHLLNSGLVVLHPSPVLLDQIIHNLNTSPNIAVNQFADQDVLAEVFTGRWRPLPWWCNALKTVRACHPEVWADEEVRLLHYILSKPWNEKPAMLKDDAVSRESSPQLPLTPDSAKYHQSERPMPARLVNLVKSSPPQKSVTQYDEVHAWWWVGYEVMLADLKAEGDGSGWQEVDAYVHR